MTNAPETRKTHVTRIVGTNRAGDVLSDIWVDVERIDETSSSSHGDSAPDSNYQKVQRKFRWKDDPNADDYNPDGNTSRETEIVKVCDPESEDVDDPEEYVEISVIKKVRMVSSDNNYQKVAEKLINSELQASREVEVRKIPHYDTNIDDAAQAAFDADPSLKVYVVPGDQYTKDLNTKDEDQYVEHEIVTKIRQRSNSSKRPGGGSDQLRRSKIKNQYLIDESDEPSGEVIGLSGVNPPYRLDPYQNIVNVRFSPRVYVVITGAKNDFATVDANKGGAKILETRQGPGVTTLFMTGTLIECSASAGENFATLNSSLVGGPGGMGGGEGSVPITMFVFPKTEEVRNSWWNYVRAYAGVGGVGDDLGPYLWISDFRGYGPVIVEFKIRYKPHLIPPVAPGVKNTIVQGYPITGSHSGTGGSGEPVTVTGFRIRGYRTDKLGTGQAYVTPPEWRVDNGIDSSSGVISGLLFGKDPPLIAADI